MSFQNTTDRVANIDYDYEVLNHCLDVSPWWHGMPISLHQQLEFFLFIKIDSLPSQHLLSFIPCTHTSAGKYVKFTEVKKWQLCFLSPLEFVTIHNRWTIKFMKPLSVFNLVTIWPFCFTFPISYYEWQDICIHKGNLNILTPSLNT